MNGSGSGQSNGGALPATDNEDDDGEGMDEEMELGEAVPHAVEEEIEVGEEDDDAAGEEQAAIAADAAVSSTASPASSTLHTPNLGPRSRAHSSPASPSIDPSMVEMWKGQSKMT